MKVIVILVVFVITILVSDMACNKISIKEAAPRLEQTLFFNFSYQDTSSVEVAVAAPDSTLSIPDTLSTEAVDSLLQDSITVAPKVLDIFNVPLESD